MSISKLSRNIIQYSDAYKLSHWKFYPPGTTHIYSYFSSRGGQFKTVVPFGLSYLLQEYLEGVVLDKKSIKEWEAITNEAMGPTVFNKAGWLRLLEKHKGILPIRIKAILEGTKCIQGIPLFTVENTDAEFPWLTNYVETLLVQNWAGTTVASGSYARREMMLNFLEQTGTSESIEYKWVDFGMRAATSMESAALDGAAHLLSFKSSDTIIAQPFARNYYNAKGIIFSSVPATEHSNITSWGRKNELEAYRNVLQAYPDGLVACVSDSYDIFNACRQLWGTDLHDVIMTRNGTTVIRPDTGTPADMVVELSEILADKFGAEENDKGYKVLNHKVRLIQGDGINYSTAYEVLSHYTQRGWSVDNLTLGEGTGIQQSVNRDTLKMALKCSAAKVDGQWQDVYKDPITDPGKKSLQGRLCVTHLNDHYHVIPSEQDFGKDILQEVFVDGKVVNKPTWEEVRARVLEE